MSYSKPRHNRMRIRLWVPSSGWARGTEEEQWYDTGAQGQERRLPGGGDGFEVSLKAKLEDNQRLSVKKKLCQEGMEDSESCGGYCLLFVGRGYENISPEPQEQEGRRHKGSVVRLWRTWSALQRSVDLSYRQRVAWILRQSEDFVTLAF